MPKKDPKRWKDVIIQSPFATLTKQEVHDYYSTPEVQQAILDAVGKREAVVRQSFAPENIVLRRKDEKGRFIHLTPKRLEEWNKKRLAEVHPTFGKKVDTLLVDVDPKEGVPWESTKRITETAAKAIRSHPDVRNVSLQFSGHRGFYIRGRLNNSIGVDRARHLTQQILGNLVQRPDVSLGTQGRIRLDTTPLKVRGSVKAPFSLDARTGLVAAPVKMEDLGKVKKRDFAIGKVLGKLRKQATVEQPSAEELGQKARKHIPNIVATLQELLKRSKVGEATVDQSVSDDISASRVNWDDPLVESTSANTNVALPSGLRYIGPDRWNSLETIQSGNNRKSPVPQESPMVMKGLQGLPKGDVPRKYAKAEFAPGIPGSRKVRKLPTVKAPQSGWTLTVQEHKARKAGKHFDLRLVGPKSDHAHSWALPKGRLPTQKDKMLLALQQPTHTRDYALNFTGKISKGYGAGTVTMPVKEKVKMLKMTNNTVKLKRPGGGRLTLFRTQENKWGIKQADAERRHATALFHYRLKKALGQLKPSDEEPKTAAAPPPIQRVTVGNPGTSPPESPWYLDPNLLKLLTVKGATDFIREKLLDSKENMD